MWASVHADNSRYRRAGSCCVARGQTPVMLGSFFPGWILYQSPVCDLSGLGDQRKSFPHVSLLLTLPKRPLHFCIIALRSYVHLFAVGVLVQIFWSVLLNIGGFRPCCWPLCCIYEGAVA